MHSKSRFVHVATFFIVCGVHMTILFIFNWKQGFFKYLKNPDHGELCLCSTGLNIFNIETCILMCYRMKGVRLVSKIFVK